MFALSYHTAWWILSIFLKTSGDREKKNEGKKKGFKAKCVCCAYTLSFPPFENSEFPHFIFQMISPGLEEEARERDASFVALFQIEDHFLGMLPPKVRFPCPRGLSFSKGPARSPATCPSVWRNTWAGGPTGITTPETNCFHPFFIFTAANYAAGKISSFFPRFSLF